MVKIVKAINSDKQNLEKNEDFDKKILDTGTFIETQDFNRFSRVAEGSENLAIKNQVETELDLVDGNTDKIKKLQAFYLLFFIGKSRFSDDGSNIYLIFQPVFKNFQILVVVLIKFEWKS